MKPWWFFRGFSRASPIYVEVGTSLCSHKNRFIKYISNSSRDPRSMLTDSRVSGMMRWDVDQGAATVTFWLASKVRIAILIVVYPIMFPPLAISWTVRDAVLCSSRVSSFFESSRIEGFESSWVWVWQLFNCCSDSSTLCALWAPVDTRTLRMNHRDWQGRRCFRGKDHFNK